MENINENNTTVATSNIHPNGAMECYKLFWTNYANFAGRARRHPGVYPDLHSVHRPVVRPRRAGSEPRSGFAASGRAFGWFFICFIPVVGAILYIIWQAQDSQPGENRFGANPKYNA